MADLMEKAFMTYGEGPEGHPNSKDLMINLEDIKLMCGDYREEPVGYLLEKVEKRDYKRISYNNLKD